MLYCCTSSYDAENRVYISPAIYDHLSSKPPECRRKLYAEMRRRIKLGQTQSVCLSADGQKLVASVIAHGQDGSVIGISSIYEFPMPSKELLMDVFGLSKAEARLAQHIARGASLKEIAANARIKISTVRSQVSAVFTKTGTKRQTKLVALLSLLAHLGAQSGEFDHVVLDQVAPEVRAA